DPPVRVPKEVENPLTLDYSPHGREKPVLGEVDAMEYANGTYQPKRCKRNWLKCFRLKRAKRDRRYSSFNLSCGNYLIS
ncbi:MAG: hypothetical protein SVO01_06315, partial [Thermotogota bacterium]|nr:hypothetical protein [Thermotogota bacterium]